MGCTCSHADVADDPPRLKGRERQPPAPTPASLPGDVTRGAQAGPELTPDDRSASHHHADVNMSDDDGGANEPPAPVPLDGGRRLQRRREGVPAVRSAPSTGGRQHQEARDALFAQWLFHQELEAAQAEMRRRRLQASPTVPGTTVPGLSITEISRVSTIILWQDHASDSAPEKPPTKTVAPLGVAPQLQPADDDVPTPMGLATEPREGCYRVDPVAADSTAAVACSAKAPSPTHALLNVCDRTDDADGTASPSGTEVAASDEAAEECCREAGAPQPKPLGHAAALPASGSDSLPQGACDDVKQGMSHPTSAAADDDDDSHHKCAKFSAECAAVEGQVVPGDADDDTATGCGKGTHHAQPECSMCLEVFLPDDRIRVLHRCVHFFHQHCIDGWLQRKRLCPACWQDVTTSDGP